MDAVTIARLIRARGNKGELAAIPFSDHPERVTRVFVNGAALEVESVWRHGSEIVFKFAGVDSISQAEALAGQDVTIPIEERPALPEGEFYHSDLIGCQVIDSRTGAGLGVVEQWHEYGGPPLVEIKTADGRELLIPFAKAIFSTIDLPAKRIVVDLPEGLDTL